MRLARYAKRIRAYTAAWLGGLVLLLVVVAQPARAATYCVNQVTDGGNITESTKGLLNALAAAKLAPEGTTHEIRVEKGVYVLSNDVILDFDENHDDKDLSLLGGYGTDCESRDLYSPGDTLIVGNNQNILQIGAADGTTGWTSFKVEGLYFRSLVEVNFKDGGTGCDNDAPGSVLITRNGFLYINTVRVDFTCAEGPDLLLNQFIRSGLNVSYGGENSPPHVGFNTFAFRNSCPMVYPIHLNSYRSGAQFHHNVVAFSADSDDCEKNIHVSGSGNSEPWTFRNNLYEKAFGDIVFPANHGNLIGLTDPGFIDPANDNYRLRETGVVSPAINAGLTLPEMSLPAVGLAGDASATDLDGNTRPIGGRFDMGAYESSAANAIVVNSTSDDNSSGTLRWAIDQANSQLGDQMIRFDLGGCPKTITLATALPPITKTLLIDGYSQDGSAKNSSTEAFNATLCVTISGPSAGLPSAFVVPAAANSSTALTVQGLAFTSRVSATAAIDLAGGSGHGVFGNLFGAPFSTSNGGVRVTSPGPVSIGGPDLSQRNVFGQIDASANSTAIELNHPDLAAVVQNNLIGVSKSGGAVAPVRYGVRALAGNKIKLLDNVVSGAEVAAIDLENLATTAVKVQGNRLGTNAFGDETDVSFSNGVSITIGSSSGGHSIGTSAGYIGGTGNTIVNSEGPGVNVRTGAGTGTRIVGNRILNNGLVDGGLAIDIGSIGQLANDQGDNDSGANTLQNFPTLSESTAQSNGKRLIKGELITAGSGDRSIAYVVSIYRSSECPDANNRGGNASSYLGGVVVSPFYLPPFGGLPSTYEGAFSIELSSTGAPGYLTATATAPDGSTSELGPCFQEPASQIPLTVVPGQVFEVVEDADVGTSLGSVQTTGEVDAFAIISGNDAGIFSIDSTGTLAVALPAPLDAAQTPTHMLGIQISDGQNTATGTVTVNVLAAGIFCDGFEDTPCPVPQ